MKKNLFDRNLKIEITTDNKKLTVKEDKIIISNNEEKSETSIENKSDKIILDINEILNKLTVEKQLNVLNYVKFIYEDK